MKEIYKVRAEVVKIAEASVNYNMFIGLLGDSCTYWNKEAVFNKYGEFAGAEINIVYKGYDITINTVSSEVAVNYGDGREEVGFYDNDEFNNNVNELVYFYAVKLTNA